MNYKKVLKDKKEEAKHLMNSDQVAKCNVAIHIASAASAASGAIPIPVADAIPITVAQVTMIIDLGKIFDQKITKSAAKGIISAAAATFVGRNLVKFIPFVGWIVSAAVAAGVTEAIGWMAAVDFARTRTKKESKLAIAQKKAENTLKKTNKKIEELGENANSLYESLTDINSLFDRIRNVPSENKLKYEKLKKIRLKWRQQAENIELEYEKARENTIGQAVAGIGAGVVVASLAPTAAMGIATTFGTASTGTAIAALHGAAATNAALAWIGGGALVAGGGGMAAGNAFLAFAGPVGWAIAGISVLASGLVFIKTKSDHDRVENIFTLISDRDTKSYKLAIVELNERIKRMVNESEKLAEAKTKIETFGTDYRKMTEGQQSKLGNYVNLMEASTMLLVNPILGLQPKYTEQDFKRYLESQSDSFHTAYIKKNKDLILSLANLLYKIELDDKDQELLVKSLKKNKEFLLAINKTKENFDIENIYMVKRALNYKYSNSDKLRDTVTIKTE